MGSKDLETTEVYSKPLSGAIILIGGIILLALGMIVAVSIGAANIDFSTVWRAVFQYDANREADQIIIGLRMPREIGAALVGAGLAVSGAIMQGMTRNALADPGLLGLNAGAGLALALVFVFIPGAHYMTIMLACFIGAGVGAALVFGLGSLKKGGLTPIRIILAGAAVSALLVAIGEGIALYFKLNQDIAFWSVGGVAGTNWEQIKLAGPVILIAIVLAISYSKTLTILSFGEEMAKGLGIKTGYVKIILMIIVLCLAGTAVAIVGNIAFVGLLVPHIVRFLVGTDYKWIIPCSAVFGSLFMVVADTFARMISAPYETPVGAVVSVIGVPFFLYLARKGGRT